MAAAIELMARGFVLARDPGLDAWAELARAVDGYLSHDRGVAERGAPRRPRPGRRTSGSTCQ
jgi:hypothetical protein